MPWALLINPICIYILKKKERERKYGFFLNRKYQKCPLINNGLRDFMESEAFDQFFHD